MGPVWGAGGAAVSCGWKGWGGQSLTESGFDPEEKLVVLYFHDLFVSKGCSKIETYIS
jgi:hypothetical protein